MEAEVAGAVLKLGEEINRAQGLFPIDGCAQSYRPHLYLGVIEEEFEEYKKEVFSFNLGKNRDTRPAMKVELLQLAAMAMRAYLEI